MDAALTLRSTYRRRPDPGTDWFGTFDLTLIGTDIPVGSRLAIWCASMLEPIDESGVTVVERLSGHLVLESNDPARVHDAGRWKIPQLRSLRRARHANDGPESAYLILSDGRTVDVRVDPAVAVDPPGDAPAPPPLVDVSTRGGVSPHRTALTDRIDVVPHPVSVIAGPAGRGPRRAALIDGGRDGLEAWTAVGGLARRLGHDTFIDADVGDIAVSLGLRADLGPSEYHLHIDGDAVQVGAGDRDALRHGLVTLGQMLATDLPQSADIVDQPTYAFRGVHLDLARRWYEPAVIERLIDLAAWRKLSHVHLHLTDDEAWRLPVEAYPALAEVGGTRGHGLAIAPSCGSGAGPYGRAYTAAEIGRWVTRADELGVVLAPEVDVPAHCHAALRAVPELRDSLDSSVAWSVQGYPNNVLVPGLPTTAPFLDAVFGTLADLFASSPILHVGGDEVPADAWAGSPAARAYASTRGLRSSAEIERSFHRDLVAQIARSTGRQVAMWEEAALGGLEPSGYAVAWTSPDAGRRLADASHRVVMAPAQAYYLDMAPGRAWHRPGASWAGNVTLADTCAFDPGAGGLGDRLIGVQACIWGEHIADLDVLNTLVFPRLDAVAERAWTGTIVGGPASLATRASRLPRFS